MTNKEKFILRFTSSLPFGGNFKSAPLKGFSVGIWPKPFVKIKTSLNIDGSVKVGKSYDIEEDDYQMTSEERRAIVRYYMELKTLLLQIILDPYVY